MSTLVYEELVAQLTDDEKARILEGRDSWFTNGIDRLGIPSLCLTDGPSGVRRVRADAGAFGVGDNEPATAFPPAATVANTWNPDNARRMGAAIAREARALGVDVLLAPGVNLKRNPLCGRNFEYYSEDPLVSSAFGTAFVSGVEGEGVASSLKHFAANSNEDYRFVGDSLVDERALRELYLRQFERVVKDARPSTVMCAYNSLNGTFCSDNRELLTDILRNEWGFDGLVMTDWGATHDRVEGIIAGCELDMPGDNEYNRAQIVAAVESNRLPRPVLDEAVRRMLGLVDKVQSRPRASAPDFASHAQLAQQIATEGAVLLTNDGSLPLASSADLVVIGELFERMRFQGAGSSLITPTHVVTPRDAFESRGVSFRYARGYRSMTPGLDEQLQQEALDLAAGDTPVLFFAGLSDLEESEGFDRTTMALGEDQVTLLTRLLDQGSRVILVLFAGAPVELPFADRLAAILDMYLPGMAGGEAVANLLFGDDNPSGKLTESWTKTASDASSAADFDKGPIARYAESIYVGYRHYDAAGTDLQFAFGHGLSYSRFEYRRMEVATRDGRISVKVEVANVGDHDGTEVVQLYVRNNRGKVFKADKELRGFTRVHVRAGESAIATVEFVLADLRYWDVDVHDWVLENGDYEILAAASAADIRLQSTLTVSTGQASRSPYPESVNVAYATPPTGIPDEFALLLGRPIEEPAPTRRLTMEGRLKESRRSVLGWILYRAVLGRVAKDYRNALALPDGIERDARVKNSHFLVRMMPFQSLRSMAMSSSGELPYDVAAGLADLAAFHPIRGLRRIFGRRR